MKKLWIFQVAFRVLLSVLAATLTASGVLAAPVAKEGESLLQAAVKTYYSKDYQRSLQLFESIAQMGSADAMYWIGRQHEAGLGVAINATRAMRWYEEAAARGSVDAMSQIGYLYSIGGKDLPINGPLALKWLEAAATRGDSFSMFRIGVVYDRGSGVNRSPAAAIKWYTAAAERGVADAMFNLSLLYMNGDGVETNPSAAMSWAKKAAELGNSSAMNSVGLLYSGGYGFREDKNLARQWFKKAIDAGNEVARSNLASMDRPPETRSYYCTSKGNYCSTSSSDVDRAQDEINDLSWINWLNEQRSKNP